MHVSKQSDLKFESDSAVKRKSLTKFGHLNAVSIFLALPKAQQPFQRHGNPAKGMLAMLKLGMWGTASLGSITVTVTVWPKNCL